MAKENYKDWGDVLYWVYANLNMLNAALAMDVNAFDRKCYMIRAKAYKAYKDGRWRIHSLFENNNWKTDWGKNTCWYCGKNTEETGKLSIEHILPKSLGGDDSFDNIAYACKCCNSSKGKKDFIEWYVDTFDDMPPLSLICIYMKLVYKFSVENGLMNLHAQDMAKMKFPFNPMSQFAILSMISDWYTSQHDTDVVAH